MSDSLSWSDIVAALHRHFAALSDSAAVSDDLSGLFKYRGALSDEFYPADLATGTLADATGMVKTANCSDEFVPSDDLQIRGWGITAFSAGTYSIVFGADNQSLKLSGADNSKTKLRAQ